MWEQSCPSVIHAAYTSHANTRHLYIAAPGEGHHPAHPCPRDHIGAGRERLRARRVAHRAPGVAIQSHPADKRRCTCSWRMYIIATMYTSMCVILYFCIPVICTSITHEFRQRVWCLEGGYGEVLHRQPPEVLPMDTRGLCRVPVLCIVAIAYRLSYGRCVIT